MRESSQPVSPKAVVWDVGRVLYQWDLRFLFGKLIADRQELEWFVTHVVTEQWHFQSDAGRSLAEMLPERKTQFPDHADLIDIYAERFLETIPAPVAGTHDLVGRLAKAGVPQFALSNFGAEFWARFRPTAPIFDHFTGSVISGEEKCAKPDPAIYAILEGRALEARAGLDPQTLFFIDDRADNIAAARARGWQGHVFTHAAALEDALACAGLI